MTVHTKDKLARALTDVGLPEMAGLAAQGYYHDYLSPLDLPELTLIGDLEVAASKVRNSTAIMNLRKRVMNGDFDASKEESDEWAASEEGRDAFRRLRGSL